eukprot:TRINITY_DN50608_c0_g1_i1.p1 TRINITY_DN50608_c0_g1~~TRINITY_DN50608_c0_g1_i1.p1  ORF type:complete len:152 (-),score=12.26 TRINITY_DN50608_c0_g1_i1:47-436(-)
MASGSATVGDAEDVADFDPTLVTVKDVHGGETDEGTHYGSHCTNAYHKGDLFYTFATSYTSNIGGARGQKHEAELSNGGKVLIIRVSHLSERTVKYASKERIALEPHWYKHIGKEVLTRAARRRACLIL